MEEERNYLNESCFLNYLGLEGKLKMRKGNVYFFLDHLIWTVHFGFPPLHLKVEGKSLSTKTLAFPPFPLPSILFPPRNSTKQGGGKLYPFSSPTSPPKHTYPNGVHRTSLLITLRKHLVLLNA